MVTASKNQRKKKKSITLSDIAEKANVSKAVASEVLRDSPRAVRFSAETVARVKAAAEELSFKSNFFAAQMHVAKRKLVMVYSSHFKDIYAAEIIEEFSSYLHAKGYQVFNASMNSMENPESEITTVCGQHGFNAVAFVGEATADFSDKSIKKLMDDEVTVVSMGRKVMVKHCQQVLFDFEHAFELLVEHFKSKNMEQRGLGNDSENSSAKGDVGKDHGTGGVGPIYVVSHDQKKNSPLERRVQQFQKIIEGSELSFSGVKIIGDMKDMDAFLDELSVQLKGGGGVPILACMTDPLAWSLQKQLQDRGVAVGEQVFITGMNDNTPSELFTPSITTVRLPMVQMGRLGAMTLLEAYEGEHESSATTLLQGELVLRESCP
jgi:LacI family transcriptional regulator